jgi:hypothetical protein
MQPLYAMLGNGTWHLHTSDGLYVVPCDAAPDSQEVLTVTLGGKQFPMQFGDLM